MKATLKSLDGLEKQIETTWPFPPYIRTPLQRRIPVLAMNESPDKITMKIRTYELDTVDTYNHPYQGRAVYREVWEE